ncbi:MBL fold metallo-hydrolase [bacterium]|nr:MBL fold metallo-hydrolase [bacterium]
MFKNKKTKILISILIIVLLSFYYIYEDSSNFLRVCFFDVGQGDSILIKSPKGKNILIDGGPSADLIQKLGNKHSYQNHQIDILILTHAHADHYFGLIEVIKRYNIKLVLWSGIDAHNSSYLHFKKLIENLNTKIAILGQEYLIEKNLKIKILYPLHYLEEGDTDLNNTSISLILSHQNIDFFLAGDLTCEGEEEIIKQNINIKSEIFKANHHGSRWSNCNYFLDKVKPELAIIQSGIDNSFGHPHQETLDRLEERNIEILRNDELGNIWIYSDGGKYWIYPVK